MVLSKIRVMNLHMPRVNFPIGNSVRGVPLGVYLHVLNFSECDAIFMTTRFRGQG